VVHDGQTGRGGDSLRRRGAAFVLRLLLRSVVVCGPLSVPAALTLWPPLFTCRLNAPRVSFVPGPVVFDAIIWVVPTAVSALAATALLEMGKSDTMSPRPGRGSGRGERSQPGLWRRFLPAHAPSPSRACAGDGEYTRARRWRRVWEAAAYVVVAFLAALQFVFILRSFLTSAWARRSALLASHPSLTWGDIVVEQVAFSLGAAGLIAALAALLPVSKGGPLVTALGIPSNEALRFHAHLGRAGVWALTAHGLGYVVFWARRGGASDALMTLTTRQPRGINNCAGLVSTLGSLLLAAAAHPGVRRLSYRAFYYAHVLGAVVFVVAAAAHWSYAAFYFAPASLLAAADAAARVRQRAGGPAVVEVKALSPTLMRLRVPLRRRDAPSPITPSTATGAYLYLASDRDGPAAVAHPFSILHDTHRDDDDNAKEDVAVIYMRAVGTWTRDVCAGARARGAGARSMSFRYSGPFSLHYPDKATGDGSLLLVGGGTGVVPMISLIHARDAAAAAAGNVRRAQHSGGDEGSRLLRRDESPSSPSSPSQSLHAKLVLVCRDAADVVMLRELRASLLSPNWNAANQHQDDAAAPVAAAADADSADVTVTVGGDVNASCKHRSADCEPRPVAAVSVAVHYTGQDDLADVRARVARAVIPSASHGVARDARLHRLISGGWNADADMWFQAVAHAIALVGIWLGVWITEGIIASAASTSVGNYSSSDVTPPLALQSWFRGVLMVVMVNATALTLTSLTGLAFARKDRADVRRATGRVLPDAHDCASTEMLVVGAAAKTFGILKEEMKQSDASGSWRDIDKTVGVEDHDGVEDRLVDDQEGIADGVLGDHAGCGVEVTKGRPDVDAHIAAELFSVRQRHACDGWMPSERWARRQLSVVAAGPPSLMREVEAAARRAGVAFVSGMEWNI